MGLARDRPLKKRRARASGGSPPTGLVQWSIIMFRSRWSGWWFRIGDGTRWLRASGDRVVVLLALLDVVVRSMALADGSGQALVPVEEDAADNTDVDGGDNSDCCSVSEHGWHLMPPAIQAAQGLAPHLMRYSRHLLHARNDDDRLLPAAVIDEAEKAVPLSSVGDADRRRPPRRFLVPELAALKVRNMVPMMRFGKAKDGRTACCWPRRPEYCCSFGLVQAGWRNKSKRPQDTNILTPGAEL